MRVIHDDMGEVIRGMGEGGITVYFIYISFSLQDILYESDHIFSTVVLYIFLFISIFCAEEFISCCSVYIYTRGIYWVTRCLPVFKGKCCERNLVHFTLSLLSSNLLKWCWVCWCSRPSPDPLSWVTFYRSCGMLSNLNVGISLYISCCITKTLSLLHF